MHLLFTTTRDSAAMILQATYSQRTVVLPSAKGERLSDRRKDQKKKLKLNFFGKLS